ncbi:MAG: vitamin B12-dependent ribonucleotide reductase [Deltaproteobacteria bacterium]|nr:vitamin B12-dependent ribonucleotide reductase [Deltaproteobacteria bacterium]
MQIGESTSVRRVRVPGGTIKHLPRESKVEATRGRRGLVIERRHTKAGEDPYASVRWALRNASIGDGSGAMVFEQKDVEVPEGWSQLATNVVASKYFRGHLGTPDREHSVRQLIGRVADTIAEWGLKDGYFSTEEDAATFRDELTYLLLSQGLAFNSPVWFNVGVEAHPQCSACFINSVEDTMESILELAKTEARLFKGGSGTGTNLSSLRSSKERLSGGGTASGPVSFMRGYDSFAGVIKSGGKTRRAAKMVILNDSHPDILEFVRSKAHEEKKAWALIAAGYDGSVNGEAYSSVYFQNANHSIRVSDDFMRAVVEQRDWTTRSITTGEPVETMKARDLMREASEAAHLCGDPGVQFDTTINLWHTCKNTGPINASNPCSEYMFLDDSACNLASLNLMRFVDPQGEFDVASFRHAVELSILAQEIIVDNSSYPTARIAENSHDFRPLGLGYANLGAVLMARGLPYDSDAGRGFAGAITALMTGHAYATSARIAESRGTFAAFEKNRGPFLGVIKMHRDHAYGLPDAHVPAPLLEAARACWDDAVEVGQEHGFRNAQVTVLAPTGTIAFMMDCDTTGIEPDIALVKYKRLVGGGVLKIVNRTVPLALQRLGYDAKKSADIVNYIEENETIEGAPWLDDADLPVFDCAFRAERGSRTIAPMGHVRMMAAAQPFLSGAISKTVNLPTDASIDDIFDVYVQAWKLGLKAIAVYRDGCKQAQPLSTSKHANSEAAEEPKELRAARRSLPIERAAITHKFSVAGHEGYLTVGLYEDGTPGEIFVTMSKEGSTISGLMDTIATSISLALQYGVPLHVLVDRFSHMRFEPSGFTGNPDIPIAKSIVDYIFRWIGMKFIRPADDHVDSTMSRKAEAADRVRATLQMDLPIGGTPRTEMVREVIMAEKTIFRTQADAPLCATCGSITMRNGTCYACTNCGTTTGCS